MNSIKIITVAAGFLALGCDTHKRTGEFEFHVKSNRREIEKIVDQFDKSKYRKITFSPPDFVTIVRSSGKIHEIRISRIKNLNRDNNTHSGIEKDAIEYVEKFRETDVISIEKSLAIYVGFPEGARLLIANDVNTDTEKLLHGKRSEQVYPGWYLFFE